MLAVRRFVVLFALALGPSLAVGCASVAFATLVFAGCSSGGSDGNGDAGGTVGPPYTTDTALIQADAIGTVPVGGRDSAADAMDCAPFSPPVPCAQGTACPTDSYCDLAQSPPVCTKYHCRPNGAACDNGSESCPGQSTFDPNRLCGGGKYCTSGLCLSGVCTDPVGEGASCAKQYCAQGLRCLGFPLACVKPVGTGGTCQGDAWCTNALGWDMSPVPDYCLAGVCGRSYCVSAAATGYCSDTKSCAAGSDCLILSGDSTGTCVQLYCGKDGIPCSKDIHCASGYGCVSGSCRQLNVAPHCAGTPLTVDCSLTAPSNPALGCTVLAASCSGTASSCANSTSDYACTQAGCQWASLGLCSGTPKACSALTSAGGCTSVGGCTWTQTASGTPTPCSQLTTDRCTQQPGCTVTNVGVY